MKIGYTNIIFEMSHKLCQALLEGEPNLAQKVPELTVIIEPRTLIDQFDLERSECGSSS